MNLCKVPLEGKANSIGFEGFFCVPALSDLGDFEMAQGGETLLCWAAGNTYE